MRNVTDTALRFQLAAFYNDMQYANVDHMAYIVLWIPNQSALESQNSSA